MFDRQSWNPLVLDDLRSMSVFLDFVRKCSTLNSNESDCGWLCSGLFAGCDCVVCYCPVEWHNTMISNTYVISIFF